MAAKKKYRIEIAICSNDKWETCPPVTVSTRGEVKAFEGGIDSIYNSAAVRDSGVVSAVSTVVETIKADKKPASKPKRTAKKRRT